MLTLIICILLAIPNIASAQTGKLSPYVRRAVIAHSSDMRKAKGTADNRAMTALVRCTDSEVLTANGCRILASFDNDIHIATIPLRRINALAAHSAVKRIETSERCSLHNDTTRMIVEVAQQAPQPPKGELFNSSPADNSSNSNSIQNSPFGGWGASSYSNGIQSSPFGGWGASSNSNSIKELPLRGLGGSLIGIQDVGFDLTHPTFYSQDGSRYRIKRMWDMIDTLNITPSLPVGGEYTTEAEILAKAHSTDNLIHTHGTHTAGTAAGGGAPQRSPLTPEGGIFNSSLAEKSSNSNSIQNSPFGGRGAYLGMAPDADIILVNNAVGTSIPLIPEEQRELYNTSLDLLGFKYIFDYADSVGKPCVINFSEGSRQDFYDSNLYDEILRQLTGPGHIIVASAGNEGNKLTHLGGVSPLTPEGGIFNSSLADNSSNSNSIQSSPFGGWGASSSSLYYNDKNFAFLTFRSQGNIDFIVTFDALGKEPVEYRVEYNDTISNIDTLNVGNAVYCVTTYVYPNCFDTLHLAGEIYIEDLTHKVIGSNEQRLAFTIPDNNNNSTELFYYGGQFIDREEYPSDADKTHNINFPGASEHVICVGMTGHRPGVYNYLGEWREAEPVVPGEINCHSSKGPTLSGLQKPDVYAPGVNIISSYSSYYLENNPKAADITWDVEHFDYNGRTYAWNSNTGTSMSAPVVTGIIALWLNECPTLTKDQLMEVFDYIRVTKADKPFCEINYRIGIDYIRQHFVENGIEEVATGDSHRHATPYIYNINGVRYPRNAADLPSGIYIVDGSFKVLR